VFRGCISVGIRGVFVAFRGAYLVQQIRFYREPQQRLPQLLRLLARHRLLRGAVRQAQQSHAWGAQVSREHLLAVARAGHGGHLLLHAQEARHVADTRVKYIKYRYGNVLLMLMGMKPRVLV
jgi:hypothetical protein